MSEARQMQVEYVRDHISENAPGPFVRLRIPTRHGGFADYDLDPTQWARLRDMVDGWMRDRTILGAGTSFASAPTRRWCANLGIYCPRPTDCDRDGCYNRIVTNPMDAVNAQREKEAAARAKDDRAKKAHEASLRVYGLSDDGWRWRELSETDKNAWRAVATALAADED